MAISPEQIADATLRIIVSQGLDVVSIRTVAKAINVAPRTVQYHMGTRDELLAKAFRHSIDRQVRRVAALTNKQALLPALASRLRELLPIGPDQRIDAAAWIIFGAASSTRPSLTDMYMDELRTFQARLTAFYEQVARAGRLADNLDATQAARLTTALVNGLAVDYLNAPAPQKIDADLESGLRLIIRS